MKTGSTHAQPMRVVRANWLPTEPIRSCTRRGKACVCGRGGNGRGRRWRRAAGAVGVGYGVGGGACAVLPCAAGAAPNEGGARTARPSVSMSFLFSFERKAAKMLAMHAASSAHTEKSATARERAVGGVLGRAARGAARQRAKRSDGPHEGPHQRAKGEGQGRGPRERAKGEGQGRAKGGPREGGVWCGTRCGTRWCMRAHRAP